MVIRLNSKKKKARVRQERRSSDGNGIQRVQTEGAFQAVLRHTISRSDDVSKKKVPPLSS